MTSIQTRMIIRFVSLTMVTIVKHTLVSILAEVVEDAILNYHRHKAGYVPGMKADVSRR
jgi:hypothetical protein